MTSPDPHPVPRIVPGVPTGPRRRHRARQVTTVAALEVARHVRGFRFLVPTVLMVLLACLATWIHRADYERRLETHRQESARQERELRQVPVYSYLRPVLLRPPEPLSVLDRGVSGHLGHEVEISPFAIPRRAGGGDRGNPFLLSFRDVDLTTVVKVVLALTALLLTFDAAVGERDRGRLVLLAAGGLERWPLLLGKLVGVVAVVLASLAAAVVPCLAIGGPWTAEQVPGLAALLAAYAAYGVVMVGVGWAISLRARRLTDSLISAVVAWLVLIFLLPQAMATLGAAVEDRWIDPRAAQHRADELKRELDARLAERFAAEPIRSRPSGHTAPFLVSTWDYEVLRRFGSARYYDSLARYHRREVELGRETAERIDAVWREEDARRRRVRGWVRALSLPSPGWLLDRLAESSAGTSAADAAAFLEHGRRYRRRFLDFLAARDATGSWAWFTDDPPQARPWPGFVGRTPEEVTAKDLPALAERFRDPGVQARLAAEVETRTPRLPIDELPPREPEGLDAAARLAGVVPELVALALWLGGLGLLLGLAWSRYDLHPPRERRSGGRP